MCLLIEAWEMHHLAADPACMGLQEGLLGVTGCPASMGLE